MLSLLDMWTFQFIVIQEILALLAVWLKFVNTIWFLFYFWHDKIHVLYGSPLVFILFLTCYNNLANLL
jgi:hypothetical protein